MKPLIPLEVSNLLAAAQAWETSYHLESQARTTALVGVVEMIMDQVPLTMEFPEREAMNIFHALALDSTRNLEQDNPSKLQQEKLRLAERFIYLQDPWGAVRSPGKELPWGWSALMTVVRQHAHPSLLDALLQAKGAPSADALQNTYIAFKDNSAERWSVKQSPHSWSALGWALLGSSLSLYVNVEEGTNHLETRSQCLAASGSRTRAMLAALLSKGVDVNAPVGASGQLALEIANEETFVFLAERGAQPKVGERKAALGWLASKYQAGSNGRYQTPANSRVLECLIEPWLKGIWTAEQARSLQLPMEHRLGQRFSDDFQLSAEKIHEFLKQWETISNQPTGVWAVALGRKVAETVNHDPKGQGSLGVVKKLLSMDVLRSLPESLEWQPGISARAALTTLAVAADAAVVNQMEEEEYKKLFSLFGQVESDGVLWKALTSWGSAYKIPFEEPGAIEVLEKVTRSLLAFDAALVPPEGEELPSDHKERRQAWINSTLDFRAVVGGVVGKVKSSPAHTVAEDPSLQRAALALALLCPKVQPTALEALQRWEAVVQAGNLPEERGPMCELVVNALKSNLALDVAQKHSPQSRSALKEQLFNLRWQPAEPVSQRKVRM